jgi:hypothetical protein
MWYQVVAGAGVLLVFGAELPFEPVAAGTGVPFEEPSDFDAPFEPPAELRESVR